MTCGPGGFEARRAGFFVQAVILAMGKPEGARDFDGVELLGRRLFFIE